MKVAAGPIPIPPIPAGALKPGALYLVPTPLDFGIRVDSPLPASQWLPSHTLQVASRLSHWIAENAKSTRAFLKRVDALMPLATPVQAQHIVELPRSSHKNGDHSPQAGLDAQAQDLLAVALQGHDVGLISEAGMPAIADPGSSIVRAAHSLGLHVVPLTGPISLMLALAASGLNGQNFAFVGYIPQESAARLKRLRELETHALQTGQTQIWIETPYRNTAVLQALLQTLQPATRLAVCCGLSLPDQTIRSAPVQQWRANRFIENALALNCPAVFLLGR